MKEALLHFIWKYRLIHPDKLETTKGEKIEILKVGTYNTNESADFLETKIKINDTVLVGNTEVHVHSSDWNKHRHHQNKKYNNVILHVVYNDDAPLENMPTLELNGKIPPYLLKRYEALMHSKAPVPCGFDWKTMHEIDFIDLQDQLISERLEYKKKSILDTLQQTQHDWLQTKYFLLLKYFGGNINQFGFQELASRLDYKILIKHADSLLQTEALLFGTAGFLEEDINDSYYAELKKEFLFLKNKYQIINLEKSVWNFLRMRPPNFPTIKMALLAKLIHTSPQLSQMQNIEQTKSFLADIQASEYWDTHYIFGKNSRHLSKKIGKNSINALLINYNIPLYYTYQTEFEQQDAAQKCIQYYEALPFEINHKIKYFNVEQKNMNALKSQAFIELYDNYCSKKKCLECRIGYRLMKKEEETAATN
jgi:hypothetical protein